MTDDNPDDPTDGQALTDAASSTEVEAAVRTRLGAIAEQTPVPLGLQARLLKVVEAAATSTGRPSPPPGPARRSRSRSAWLALLAAATAALLVIGSATWWTLRREQPDAAGPRALTTLPWDASTMEPVDGLLDPPAAGSGNEIPAGTPGCTSAQLRVVSVRTTSDGSDPGARTTEVGLRSVATGPCTVVSRGETIATVSDLVPQPAPVPLLVPTGHLVHLRVSWPSAAADARPTALRLTVGTGPPPGATLSVDVSGATAPTSSRGSDPSPQEASWAWWTVTSIAGPGTLSSLTATTRAVAGGWFGSGPTAAGLRLTNDSDTMVSLRPCPDLLVSSVSTDPSANVTLRGPLACGPAPESLRPGDQLEIGLLPADGESSSSGSGGASSGGWHPMTAQVARGDDVVGATSSVIRLGSPRAVPGPAPASTDASGGTS